jgi:uncharacterized protein YndB with AHSA1/START domain
MAEPAPDRRLGLTVTRVLTAPRDRVWREWTEPERFAGWFGGPDADVPLDTVTMDVRPGGGWRATMFSGPERREIRWEGAYREVHPPERLVFTISDAPGREEDAHELVVVVLRDLGDGRTEMLVEQHGHMPPDVYDAARNGWGVFFDAMAGRLAAAG